VLAGSVGVCVITSVMGGLLAGDDEPSLEQPLTPTRQATKPTNKPGRE